MPILLETTRSVTKSVLEVYIVVKERFIGNCIRGDTTHWERAYVLRCFRHAPHLWDNYMVMHMRFVVFFSLVLLGFVLEAEAQTMRLREQGTNARDINVQVGQTVTIEVYGELANVEAAGLSVFITVPDDAFQVVDQRPTTGATAGQPGVQPFIQGPLFTGAGEQSNDLIPETESIASTFPGQQLEYALVVGGVGDRVRSGTGVIATFQLVCVQPIDFGQIQIDDNAILETRLVLSDGISERRFVTTQGMQISVSGLELLDIPDVILTPGESDSTQIGRLTRYVQSARPSVNIDSILWSVEPTDLDSIQIEIDPITTRVKVLPHPEWSGRQRVIWTATEPESAVRAGEPVLSVQEASDIIVNNPPTFIKERDPDGVRRDTVRFAEDAFSFIPGTTPSTRRAFTALNLNDLAQDPDEDVLRFLSLTFGADPDPNIRSQIVQDPGNLLLWSRQEFTGTDSLKILAIDGLRGGNDTLRVIIEVTPVADAPNFLLNDEERQPKISRGGTQTYLLHEILEDVDTPLDSLAFSWVDDPGENFTVDTTRTSAGLEVSIKGLADFSGGGRISFSAIDPEGLEGTMILFITASESLPPTVLQNEIKINITPGGLPRIEDLDNFVSDPDNNPDQLQWIFPPGSLSNIGIDENRDLSVGAPVDFIGYEEVILTVSDPNGQADELKLRIYSSEGGPVAGGLPDLILDRGDIHQEIDLDNYYFDSDNEDTEIFWELPRNNSFDSNNLEVQVDPITHIVTFLVPETASFATEPVIFRVTDPAGQSATDTMNVSIRSGGNNVAEQFNIRTLPNDVQIIVGQRTDIFDLDEFVLASADFDISTLNWSVSVLSGKSTGPQIADGNVVRVFGFEAGTDTVLFTAQDTLGRVQTSTSIIRVIGESEALNLLSIPDIQFIAGQQFRELDLSNFIEDDVTHPDSLIQWSVSPVGDPGSLIIRVNDDNSVLAIADDTLEVEVVFTARNISADVFGRDTVRVIALDPSLANRALQSFPPLTFTAGRGDSSIVLNEFLPSEFVSLDGVAPSVIWTVSGQNITQPVIGTVAPHQLVVSGVGERVGIDTLTIVANISGGFKATGQMQVTVVEAVDASTLDLQIVPNAIEPSFIDVFVIARRALAGTPNVIRSFETIDSTVAVRQIEEDLAGRGVLIWGGSVQLRGGASGLVSFETQAFTELGTNVGDTASVDIATVLAGKRVALSHAGAHIDIGPNVVSAGKMLVLQTEFARESGRAKRADDNELELLYSIDAYPAGLELATSASLSWQVEANAGDGLYRRESGRWVYLGAADESVPIEHLGRYGLLRDKVAPRVYAEEWPDVTAGEWALEIEEEGSGLSRLELLINGRLYEGQWEGGVLRWQADQEQHADVVAVELRASDRAGNQSVWRGVVSALPSHVELGANYPNPFNPETILPLVVPAPARQIQLSVYNSAGQLVRELLNEKVNPGRYQVLWDGRDQRGFRVSSGVYLYRVQTQGAVLVRRMTLLK